MQRLLRNLAAKAVLLGGIALTPRPAAAYGGFFGSEQLPIQQSGARVILVDNGNGTVTAVVGVSYAGSAQNFAWLLPIGNASDVELTLAPTAALLRLEAVTTPQFYLNSSSEGACSATGQATSAPRETCEDNPVLAGCAPDFRYITAAESIDPVDWQVITGDPAAADPATPALEWLTANGYDVTPEGAARLGVYLAEGMNLLALRLSTSSLAGSIRPIQLTMPATSPVLPITLTSLSATPNMPITTWVLSPARAVPANFEMIELNEARLDWFRNGSNYRDLVPQAIDEAGGNAFITEFASPSPQLAGVVWTPGEEIDWQRLRATAYVPLEEKLQRAYDLLQAYDGFSGALRRTLALDEDLDLEGFRRCPSCYVDLEELSPDEFFAAMDAAVLQPLRGIQSWIDAAPYTTRLLTTLSSARTTVDPVFASNPDLPQVSQYRRAEHVLECNGVPLVAAPWRIDFPQGTTLRGTTQNGGTWPPANSEQPANFRVTALDATGTIEVVTDNSALIADLLADYNATLPPPAWTPTPSSDRRSRADGCALPSGRPSGNGAPLALSALLGAAWLRRRR